MTAAEGDLLVVRTNGSLNLVGRCAVVPVLPEETAFASYLIRLRCDKARVLPDFIQLMLRYLRDAGHLIDFARTTAGQYNVSLGRLRAARVPVPKIERQRAIVDRVRVFEGKLAVLRRLQEDTAAEMDALIPAILERAFRGEL